MIALHVESRAHLQLEGGLKSRIIVIAAASAVSHVEAPPNLRKVDLQSRLSRAQALSINTEVWENNLDACVLLGENSPMIR